MAFALPTTKSPKSLTALLNITVQALGFIAKLTKTVKDDQAVVVLKAIQAAIKTAEAGYSGAITSNGVRDELAKLTKAIAANDAKAIDALRAKFGK